MSEKQKQKILENRQQKSIPKYVWRIQTRKRKNIRKNENQNTKNLLRAVKHNKGKYQKICIKICLKKATEKQRKDMKDPYVKEIKRKWWTETNREQMREPTLSKMK